MPSDNECMPSDNELPTLFADDTAISLKAGNEKDLWMALESVAFNVNSWFVEYCKRWLRLHNIKEAIKAKKERNCCTIISKSRKFTFY